MDRQESRKLWMRWVVANSLAEALGLGSTLAIGLLLSSRIGEAEGVGPSITTSLAMVASGGVEGVVVGFMQWWAMHQRFRGITAREWVGATILGALIAWLLGVIPFTVANLSAMGEEVPSAEPEPLLALLIIGLIGAAAGAVLAMVQWLVLRRKVKQAWRWLPANSAAWSVGLPLVFAVMSAVPQDASPPTAGFILFAGLALTGAMVGAVHGTQLVRFDLLDAKKVRRKAWKRTTRPSRSTSSPGVYRARQGLLILVPGGIEVHTSRKTGSMKSAGVFTPSF